MLRDRTFNRKKEATVFHQERFYPSGNYTWQVPEGCDSVDVFLVGGGGGCGNIASGAGGYTRCFKEDASGYRDGYGVQVVPGQNIQIVVGGGGYSYNTESCKGDDGGYSQFMNSSYRANGGGGGEYTGSSGNRGAVGDGGAGACGWRSATAGSDGSDGTGGSYMSSGKGQGYTSRDFGEPNGNRNAGGGGSGRGGSGSNDAQDGGVSDYIEGSGSDASNTNTYQIAKGGGGYGGGASGPTNASTSNIGDYGPGGDGTVLIRYRSYK